MPLPPTVTVEGASTTGATAAGADVVLRRLAALAMRRATEERVGLAEVVAAFRVLDLVVGLDGAVVAAVRLRPTVALRVERAAFAFVAGFAFAGALATGLAFDGLALAADRVERALAGATG